MASMYVPKQSSCHTCWRPFCSRVSPTPHTHGDWLQLVVTQITVSLIQLPGAFCSLWTQKISLIYYILLSTCKEGLLSSIGNFHIKMPFASACCTMYNRLCQLCQKTEFCWSKQCEILQFSIHLPSLFMTSSVQCALADLVHRLL